MISCKNSERRAHRQDKCSFFNVGRRTLFSFPASNRKKMQANPKAADRPQLLLLPDLSGLSITLNYSTSINTFPETF